MLAFIDRHLGALAVIVGSGYVLLSAVATRLAVS
jgi:hypothetical protein